jgi:hypothetical protein
MVGTVAVVACSGVCIAACHGESYRSSTASPATSARAKTPPVTRAPFDKPESAPSAEPTADDQAEPVRTSAAQAGATASPSCPPDVGAAPAHITEPHHVVPAGGDPIDRWFHRAVRGCVWCYGMHRRLDRIVVQADWDGRSWKFAPAKPVPARGVELANVSRRQCGSTSWTRLWPSPGARFGWSIRSLSKIEQQERGNRVGPRMAGTPTG